jgi:hypothetical protein
MKHGRLESHLMGKHKNHASYGINQIKIKISILKKEQLYLFCLHLEIQYEPCTKGELYYFLLIAKTESPCNKTVMAE